MTQESNLLLSLLTEPQQFESWLEQKGLEEVVGTRGDAAKCPVAKFLAQAGLRTLVHPDHIAIYESDNRYFFRSTLITVIDIKELENWVGEFIKNIDDQTPNEVTANKALTTLKELKRD